MLNASDDVEINNDGKLVFKQEKSRGESNVTVFVKFEFKKDSTVLKETTGKIVIKGTSQ